LRIASLEVGGNKEKRSAIGDEKAAKRKRLAGADV
jgi:hypothetical protein